MGWRVGALVVLSSIVLLGGETPSEEVTEVPALRFAERAAEAGIRFRMAFLPNEQGQNFKINLYDHGCGVLLGDVDGDGDDDLYFLNQLGSNALYRNNGDGTFADVTAASGPIGLADRISVSGAFNDIDNDGDQDLFVTTTRGGNVLFRNEGGGRFVDVTKAAGVGHVGHSQGATFFDADGDGDLDLFVTNTARWTTSVLDPVQKYYIGPGSLLDLIDSPIELNLFYLNKGDGTFEDATARAGLAGAGWGGDMAVFDFDGDGDSDLFVGNMFGKSQLYRNDGQGRFEDVTQQVLGRTPFGTVGARAFDYDGDGLLDLFVVDMHSDMWMPSHYDPAKIEEGRKYPGFFGREGQEPGFDKRREKSFAEKTKLKYDTVFFGNALYRNLGGGKFEEVSDRANAETFWPWGVAEGDFDNDGHEDAYLPSGMGYPFFYWRSPLLHNRGDGTFADRTAEAGLDPLPGGTTLPVGIGGRPATRSSRSAAAGDLDGDGRLDLVVNNFNDAPFLYANRCPSAGAWIAFRLTGTNCNRDAVGAVVRLKAGGRTLVRQVQAAGGYLGQSSKTLHFGLGAATAVESAEIRWPDGSTQVLEAPEPGQLHSIRQ